MPAHRRDGGRDRSATGPDDLRSGLRHGGFLLAAHDYIAKHYQLDRAQKKKLKSGTFLGIELVDSVTRLCAMNLLLHGRQPVRAGRRSLESGLPVVTKDAQAAKHGECFIVLANPPFRKKSSVTIVNEANETAKESLIINRETTSGRARASASRTGLTAQFPPAHLHHP